MPRCRQRNAQYAAYLYERLQRQGYLLRDVQRLVNTDRNHFAACMVALDDADAMVTGVTRNFSVALEDVRRVIDPKPGHRVIGISLVLARGRNVLVADTAITEMPKAAGPRRHRDRGGRRRAAARLRAAARAAGVLDVRPSAGRALGACHRGGEDPRPAPRRFRIRRRDVGRRRAQSGSRGAPIRSAGCRGRPTC